MRMIPVGNPHKTFEDAFRQFYAEVKKMLAEGTSWQVLETMCFIMYEFTEGRTEFYTMMGFYDCKDLAYQMGLMYGEGELAEKPSSPISIEDIQETFMRNTSMEIYEILELMECVTESAPVHHAQPAPTSPTFKPLLRNRFKCNQTGRIVKKGQLNGYRSSLEKVYLRQLNA